jgi:hypothetical protein
MHFNLLWTFPFGRVDKDRVLENLRIAIATRSNIDIVGDAAHFCYLFWGELNLEST